MPGNLQTTTNVARRSAAPCAISFGIGVGLMAITRAVSARRVMSLSKQGWPPTTNPSACIPALNFKTSAGIHDPA